MLSTVTSFIQDNLLQLTQGMGFFGIMVLACSPAILLAVVTWIIHGRDRESNIYKRR